LYIANSTEKSILFQHRFWLQILGDHSRFILNALSSKEKAHIDKANYFITVFDKLLGEARENLDKENITTLSEEILIQVKRLRKFKLDLLKEHIIGKIEITLPPTFINHMVNELEEYLKILIHFLSNEPLKNDPIHQHLLWLLDGSGHAIAIYTNLDDVEKILKKKSKEFQKHFDDIRMKALEFRGYMRTNIDKFPALSKLNKQAELEMLLFMSFLNELEELRISKVVLGTINPLILDHMFREECYYLTMLSQVSEVKKPDCDPTKPRIES
jgi:hypothetical protein